MVCRLKGSAQRRRLIRFIVVVNAMDDIRSHAAGNFARRMPADAIGNQSQYPFAHHHAIIERTNVAARIFIHLAATARISHQAGDDLQRWPLTNSLFEKWRWYG